MEIEIFTLCDFAKIYGGRLVLSGPFDVITAPNTPCTHLSCSLAMRIRFLRSEGGKHDFKFLIIDIDGNEIGSQYTGTINVDVPQGQNSRTIDLPITIPGLTFQKFGEYSIRLVINGEEKRSLPIFVKKIDIPTPPEALENGSGNES